MSEIRRIETLPGGRGRPVPAHPSELAGPAGASASSRALVAVLPAPSARPRDVAPSARPDAGFLAHLVATAQQAPQTRTRRRTEPADAGAIYAAAAAPRRETGRLLSRAI